MPMKAEGPAVNATEIDRFEGGVGWIAHPEERMQRASHALVADDGGVWVVEPVDTPDLDERLDDLGEVRGVVVLLDRHVRDAVKVADRHDVPVRVPEALAGLRSDLDAAVEPFRGALPKTDYRTIILLDSPVWTEVALYDEAAGTLLVPESVGTAEYFRAPGERLGVHPARRLIPPRPLRGLAPARILVGHGEGVFDDPTVALRKALSGSRSNAAHLYARTLRGFLPL